LTSRGYGARLVVDQPRGLADKGFQMSKFVVIAGSRPKRAWAGVYEVFEGKNWFEASTDVAYYETGCSMWDDCDCCSFDDASNIASVLAEAGMVLDLAGEQVFVTDNFYEEGGFYAPLVVKA
jgi:hypothetical protein